MIPPFQGATNEKRGSVASGWVGYLVKWRNISTSAAERAARTGGSGVEMATCVVWSGRGDCLIAFWKEGTPSYSGYYDRGFG